MELRSIKFGKYIRVEWTSGECEEDLNSISCAESPLLSMNKALYNLIPHIFNYLNLPNLRELSIGEFKNFVEAGCFQNFSILSINITRPAKKQAYKFSFTINLHYYAYKDSQKPINIKLANIYVKPQYKDEDVNYLIEHDYASPEFADAINALMDEGLKYANGERLQPKLPGI